MLSLRQFTRSASGMFMASCGIGRAQAQAHLHGASQLMIGTDYPIPWVEDPVSHVLETPELSDANRIAILGGTAEKLLRLS